MSSKNLFFHLLGVVFLITSSFPYFSQANDTDKATFEKSKAEKSSPHDHNSQHIDNHEMLDSSIEELHVLKTESFKDYDYPLYPPLPPDPPPQPASEPQPLPPPAIEPQPLPLDKFCKPPKICTASLTQIPVLGSFVENPFDVKPSSHDSKDTSSYQENDPIFPPSSVKTSVIEEQSRNNPKCNEEPLIREVKVPLVYKPHF